MALEKIIPCKMEQQETTGGLMASGLIILRDCSY